MKKKILLTASFLLLCSCSKIEEIPPYYESSTDIIDAAVHLVVHRHHMLVVDFGILVFDDIHDVLHNRVGGGQASGSLADERRRAEGFGIGFDRVEV